MDAIDAVDAVDAIDAIDAVDCFFSEMGSGSVDASASAGCPVAVFGFVNFVVFKVNISSSLGFASDAAAALTVCV